MTIVNDYGHITRIPANDNEAKPSALRLHLHIAARCILDRLELAVARCARRHLRLVVMDEPGEPVRPPGARMLGRLREPAVEIGAARFWAGPVLIFVLLRRVDHAGDMTGPG